MKNALDKKALKEELVQLLKKDLEILERAQQAATEGATHAEAKPENDKDTRALEQSYLARGQAQRVEEMRAGLGMVQAWPIKSFAPGAPAALGAFITVEESNGDENTFLMAPHGGGYQLERGTVQVVTPKSPLGQALLGKCQGDECQLVVAGRKREITILAVQ